MVTLGRDENNRSVDPAWERKEDRRVEAGENENSHRRTKESDEPRGE